MPLLDHFHPPLSQRRHWEALHTRWASALADQLNLDWLPEPFFAEPQVSLGGQIQVDVATLEERSSSEPTNGSTATALRTWTAPPAIWTMPAKFLDVFEVRVVNGEEGPRLVAAVELVSPGNKDRPDTRRTFAGKCASYLSQGISLIVVDVVTSRLFNLHNQLMELLEQPAYLMPAAANLYAVAYHPVRRDATDVIDVWPTALQINEALPTLPLFPAANLNVPVDLEAAYSEACEKLRLV